MINIRISKTSLNCILFMDKRSGWECALCMFYLVEGIMFKCLKQIKYNCCNPCVLTSGVNSLFKGEGKIVGRQVNEWT